MASSLALLRCADAVRKRVSGDEVRKLAAEVAPAWRIGSEDEGTLAGRLVYQAKVKDFPAALAAVNKAGEVAEAEQHHPDLRIHGWNNLELILYTHDLGGLTKADFIMAAKLAQVLPEPSQPPKL